MTLRDALEMIDRGETPEQFRKRLQRIHRLASERDALQDAIEVLGDDPRAEKKRARLAKVERELEVLI